MNTGKPPTAGDSSAEELHTVGEVAHLAKVTVRTLHHYDRIGLLVPSRRAKNGYRLYGYADLERLRQILLLRELGFGLDGIGQMLDAGAFDQRRALVAQRDLLRERQRRTERIIAGVEGALEAMEEKRPMAKARMFEGLQDFDHEQYEDEARERWGRTDAYKESMRRTRRYSKDDWTRIKAEAEDVMARLSALLEEGGPAAGRGGGGRGSWRRSTAATSTAGSTRAATPCTRAWPTCTRRIRDSWSTSRSAEKGWRRSSGRRSWRIRRDGETPRKPRYMAAAGRGRGAADNLRLRYTSRFLTYLAFLSMNSRRGCTSSPMRRSKRFDAMVASSMSTRRMVRASGSMVVRHS